METQSTAPLARTLIRLLIANTALLAYGFLVTFIAPPLREHVVYISWIALLGAMFQAAFAAGAIINRQTRLLGIASLIASPVAFGAAALLGLAASGVH